MKNYKVGDEVILKGKIDEIDSKDSKRTYRIDFGKSDFENIFWMDNDSIIGVDNHKSYEDGLRDAWEMARIYSRMEEHEIDEIFNGVTNPDYFFDVNYWTPGEAIHRYNEKTVRPGDVVYINGKSNLDNKYVILDITSKEAFGYRCCNDGVFKVQNLSFAIGAMEKTGEHVDLSYLTNGGVKENG